MAQFKISHLFNTLVEGEPGNQKFYTYGGMPDLGKQILSAMKILGIDISQIYGLQYGGRNKYILYPNTNTPLINLSELRINGQSVMISEIEPIVREIEQRSIDVFVSGLPL
ncbi:hypothetical protein ACJMK2_040959 [Sinanodonta woodiana]|uniref:Uncharacterized protein n=1 Tax=Sinanodonta woodiana TaxID=1069815 RepID=A0ABD3W5Y4_SINWO